MCLIQHRPVLGPVYAVFVWQQTLENPPFLTQNGGNAKLLYLFVVFYSNCTSTHRGFLLDGKVGCLV